MIDLAALSDIPDPGVLSVRWDGRAICLVRVGNQVSAFVDECPHAGMPLSEGEVVGGCELECSWHGARFDCASGALLHGPAGEGLVAVPVRVVDGRVLGDRVET